MSEFDGNNEDGLGRYAASFNRHYLQWLVLDLWAGPGNYIMGFQNGAEAVAEAYRLNNQDEIVVPFKPQFKSEKVRA